MFLNLPSAWVEIRRGFDEPPPTETVDLMAVKRDYYEVLGVEKTCSTDDVKRAYRKLAMKYHPDKNPGDKDAERSFKEAAEAYEVLGDQAKRERYDRHGHSGVEGGVHDFNNIDEIFDAFGDLFGGLFGDRRGGGGRRRGPRPGDDLQVTANITLEEAARGVDKTLVVRRNKTCSTCTGSGAAVGSSPTACSMCGGRGQVIQARGPFRIQTTCPTCKGRGSIITNPCTSCRGSGKTVETAEVPVPIPPGVDSGMRLRLSGQGEDGEPGAPRGDLYVVMEVKQHPFFERNGRDLHCRVPIPYSLAALGGDFEVPTLGGKKTVTLPKGSPHGHITKLRHEGMPDVQGRGRGDLLIETNIEIPKKL
ncbi:MAG: molecular chaperone DnaJ, partial [Planctomycetia bacterium]